MSDYNRELHHDEHHEEISRWRERAESSEAQLSAVQDEAAERGFIISGLRVRIKELEAEHQLRYGFEAKLERAEKVVEAAKEEATNFGASEDLWKAIRQYEDGRDSSKPSMGLAEFFHGYKREAKDE